MFLFTHNNTQIYEVLKFDEPYRSWFVGQTVQRGKLAKFLYSREIALLHCHTTDGHLPTPFFHLDGSMMMTSPVDPLFLILPYLVKSEQVILFADLVTGEK